MRLPPHNTPVLVAMEDKSGGEGEAGESRVQRMLRRRRRMEQPTEVSLLGGFSFQMLFLNATHDYISVNS